MFWAPFAYFDTNNCWEKQWNNMQWWCSFHHIKAWMRFGSLELSRRMCKNSCRALSSPLHSPQTGIKHSLGRSATPPMELFFVRCSNNCGARFSISERLIPYTGFKISAEGKNHRFLMTMLQSGASDLYWDPLTHELILQKQAQWNPIIWAEKINGENLRNTKIKLIQIVAKGLGFPEEIIEKTLHAMMKLVYDSSLILHYSNR